MNTENKTKTGRSVRKRMVPVNSTVAADLKKIAYKNLRASGMPARSAKQVLGINTNTNVTTKLTVDQQREQALQDLNITIKSQFKTLREIRDSKKMSCPSDRIHAVKTINSMVPGFSAPQQVMVNNTALMIEFAKIPTAHLSQLAHDLKIALIPQPGDDGFDDIDDAEYEDVEC